MIYRTHSFAHHGRSFTVEADGWPSDETASAAIIDLQTWTLQHDKAATAALHYVLSKEREALVFEQNYDRNTVLLPALRQAQRDAVRNGLAGVDYNGNRPTVTLEAFQVSRT